MHWRDTLGERSTEWRDRGIIPNEHLASGTEDPWSTWRSLNRLRVQKGRCRAMVKMWKLSQTDVTVGRDRQCFILLQCQNYINILVLLISRYDGSIHIYRPTVKHNHGQNHFNQLFTYLGLLRILHDRRPALASMVRSTCSNHLALSSARWCPGMGLWVLRGCKGSLLPSSVCPTCF